MTRPTKRRIANAVDDLEAEITVDGELSWRDFMLLAAGDTEPADYDLTQREVDIQWLAKYGLPAHYDGDVPPDVDAAAIVDRGGPPWCAPSADADAQDTDEA